MCRASIAEGPPIPKFPPLCIVVLEGSNTRFLRDIGCSFVVVPFEFDKVGAFVDNASIPEARLSQYVYPMRFYEFIHIHKGSYVRFANISIQGYTTIIKKVFGGMARVSTNTPSRVA